MGKLISASIDVTKIDKSRIVEGKKGKYLNLTIWIKDQPDQYGNDVSVEQTTEKDETKIYLGNGKIKWTSDKKDESRKTSLDMASDTAKFQSDNSDLPF